MTSTSPALSPIEHETLWTTEQVAAFLSVAPKTIRKWQLARRIPFVKLNGSVRYVPSQLREWIQENMQVPTPDPVEVALAQIRRPGAARRPS